jgi:hypothetical protein
MSNNVDLTYLVMKVRIPFLFEIAFEILLVHFHTSTLEP